MTCFLCNYKLSISQNKHFLVHDSAYSVCNKYFLTRNEIMSTIFIWKKVYFAIVQMNLEKCVYLQSYFLHVQKAFLIQDQSTEVNTCHKLSEAFIIFLHCIQKVS